MTLKTFGAMQKLLKYKQATKTFLYVKRQKSKEF